MDHTLIQYNSRHFEHLAYKVIVEKLIKEKQYPETIKNLKFDYDLAIRGLILDLNHGNLLKVSRYAAIRKAYHGTQSMDFNTQQTRYKSTYIDPSEPNVSCVDTHFSISYATLFAQLVDLKDKEESTALPDYVRIGKDVLQTLDLAHRDGTLKKEVQAHLEQYILRDETCVRGLETFKRHGKKLFLLTNSDFAYTQTILNYAINPFLKEHHSWTELFEYIITQSQKPRFFHDSSLRFLKINPADGTMINYDKPLVPGIYQGGCADLFSNELKAQGDEILYIGDHIYGDILRLKKDCNWRTALVIEELESEIQKNIKAKPFQDKIDQLMGLKEPLEKKLIELNTLRAEASAPLFNKNELESIYDKISALDREIGSYIQKHQSLYNPHWGEVMRAGNEESYFAYQVERYACIYMAKLQDFVSLSPRAYLRARKRLLPHEVNET